MTSAPWPEIRRNFPASLEQVEHFIADVHGYLADQGLGALAFDMELLAREALVNAVRHGSASDPAKRVHASLARTQDGLLLCVRDEGGGWDWRARQGEAPEPTSEAGRGLFIIRKYADAYSYNEQGNALTIVKRAPLEDAVMDTNADSAFLLTLGPRVTAQDVPALREELRARIQAGVNNIRMDFSKVESLDSMGIGLLVATHNSLLKTGGKLTLTGVGKDIRQLLALMRLDQHIAIATGEEG
jgi:anti-anti-sigma factor